MAININREVEDTFYRYKMPKIQTKVEGKGNGIKTVLVNVCDISKALYRKSIYVTKYFGFELGAQARLDDKNARYIVNGAHVSEKLQTLLDNFIKKFVLCSNCGNPETDMHVVNKRSGSVVTICKACGSHSKLEKTHRLTQFIAKDLSSNEVVSDQPVKTVKKKVNVKSSNKNGDKSYVDDNDDDIDWLEDTSEEAQQRRMNALSSVARLLALSPDVEKSETERADLFYKFVKQIYVEGKILTSIDEIVREATRLDISDLSALVLPEVLIDDPSSLMSDLDTYSKLFLRFTQSDAGQLYLWQGIQKIIEKNQELLPMACHLMKKLYDLDLLTEDVILEWYDDQSSEKANKLSRNIKQKCSVMVNWLRQAEEESDEESDQEEDAIESIEEIASEESDEEIDIDAI